MNSTTTALAAAGTTCGPVPGYITRHMTDGGILIRLDDGRLPSDDEVLQNGRIWAVGFNGAAIAPASHVPGYVWVSDGTSPDILTHRICAARGWCPAEYAVTGEPACGCAYVTECPQHGATAITDQGSGQGFAGGSVYWANLACGCTDLDESADLRAAI